MQTLAVMLAVTATPPKIPRTWRQSDVDRLEVPLANAKYSAVHISEEEYYRIPVRVIYRSYPVYRPGREPAGYLEWLRRQDPLVSFDASNLKTREDWVTAGALVFNAATSYNPVFFGAAQVRDPAFYERAGMPVANDGTIPFARWVIRRKGEVELGSMGCNTCHIRVLPDGTIVPGAQGNNPGDREGAEMLRRAARFGDCTKIQERIRGFALQFEMPWLADDPNRRARTMSLDNLIAAGEAIPPGVTARSNTSIFLPPQIPDLIGVEQRRYLDHTGLVRHRGVGDLMRYCSLVQDISEETAMVSHNRCMRKKATASAMATSNYMRSRFICIRCVRRGIRTPSTRQLPMERQSSNARVALRATRRPCIQTTSSFQWMDSIHRNITGRSSI